MINARISIPNQVKANELIHIRTLASHPMETGYRNDSVGKRIPRNIIVRFECRFEGELVFATDMGPGIAANPYLAFKMRCPGAGTVEFMWRDQVGEETRLTRILSLRD